jgi:hypothetical protein
MKYKINGFYALNFLLFVLAFIFLLATGIKLVSSGDKQEKICMLICYALLFFLSIMIISARYYSRARKLRNIPKVHIPITRSELPDVVYEHIQSQLKLSMETKVYPTLNNTHMPPGWENRPGDGGFIDCRERTLKLFTLFKNKIHEIYPEEYLEGEPIIEYIKLLEKKNHIDPEITSQLRDIYLKARYSQHTISSNEMSLVEKGLNRCLNSL